MIELERAALQEHLAEGKRVRRTLEPWGRLHLDRSLPFLCLYRRPREGAVPGVESLVTSEACYLYADEPAETLGPLRALLSEVTGALTAAEGPSLLLELWLASPPEDALPRGPRFTIVTGPRSPDPAVIDLFASRLRRIKLARQPAEVEVRREPRVAPSESKAVFGEDRLRSLELFHLGLEIEPSFVASKRLEPAPLLLRRLRRQLSKAMRWLFHEFAQGQEGPAGAGPSAHVMAPRRLERAALEADAALAAVSAQLSFILAVTPINMPALWRAWQRNEAFGDFVYRPLTVDPYQLKRELYAARIERVEDPALAALLRQLQLELDQKLTLLLDIGRPRFLYGSQQVFGGVDPETRAEAHALLDLLPEHDERAAAKTIPSTKVAPMAEEEIERYRAKDESFAARVELRADLSSGMMCSRGNLLIANNIPLGRARIEALLAHEVGTHLVTYYNGLAQPLTLFGKGLANYIPLQEGLAVLAELLVGQLDANRLRLLAGRVVAVDALLAGAEPPETIRLLREDHGFPERTAFRIAVRVHRGGGLTKDMVYLRGLRLLLDYLGRGRSLEPLYVGKIGLEHVGVVEELLQRELLAPPRFRPRYLAREDARRRLDWLREGQSVSDLLKAPR